MPIFERDGVRIHYETCGDGYPLLVFAPGGMRSAIELWDRSPYDPTTALREDFRVIAMDQRNAGRSRAPVAEGDGWDTYAADHIALLDHLGIERAHVLGMCIGSSFCLNLARLASHRVSAAVLQNPIGLAGNRQAFETMFDQWAAELSDREDARPEALTSLRANLFGGDFVFSVTRDFVRQCPVPLLVLAGADLYHPTAIAEEIAQLSPRADLLLDWRTPEVVDETVLTITRFLQSNTPAGASGVASDVFHRAYEETAPWDIGTPQPEVVRLAEHGAWTGRILDIGLGSGANAVFLAERGHEVFGIDIVPQAVEAARRRAEDARVADRVHLQVTDALSLKVDKPFDTALDAGVFHAFSDEDRPRYAATVAAALKPGARLHLICFCEHQPGGGPRRVTQAELRKTFTAPLWTVESIEAGHYDTRGGPKKAWVATMRRL